MDIYRLTLQRFSFSCYSKEDCKGVGFQKSVIYCDKRLEHVSTQESGGLNPGMNPV